MGYDSGSSSHDGRDEDDDEEYEDIGGGNRLLGFMFGNVDGSGDLDVDYLDEDAKEHLGALADKLGPSLADIDLSGKSPQTSSEAAERDYDEKAVDAVDYEDFDEEYEGPEVQAATEEDFLLPKKQFYSQEVSLNTLENAAPMFDDENYDEDDDVVVGNGFPREDEVVDKNANTLPDPSSDHNNEAVSDEEKVREDVLPADAIGSEVVLADAEDSEEDDDSAPKESVDLCVSTSLPILCVEDGLVILRFSEIFGVNEPLKKERKDRRYFVPREKYKSMDTCDIAEEDEEEFLRGSCENLSYTRVARASQNDIWVNNDDDIESALYGIGQGPDKVVEEVSRQKNHSCHSSVPMKEGLPMKLSQEWDKPFSPKFYPLDQQDWEDNIIWADSPELCANAAESCEISGPDSDALADKIMDLESEARVIQSEVPHGIHEKDHDSYFHNQDVSVESFSSRQSPGHTSLTSSVHRYHPQMLRLDSRLDMDNLSSYDVQKDGQGDLVPRDDVIRRLSKLTLRNREEVGESWLDNIIWEPQQFIREPKLILDLQDEQMYFEVLDSKDDAHLQLHAGAMVVSRSVKPGSGDSYELHGHGVSSGGRFNIANDKFYSNRKSSQQLKSHSKKRTSHVLKILHSIPALKLQTMKAKLSNKDVAHFHRPKALWFPHDNEVVLKEQRKLPTQGPMKIILKSLGGKGSKLHVDAEETISSVKAKASKKFDFKLSEPVKIFYSGNELEDQKSLAAENVRPNSLLHLVRTKIHPLPKAQRLPGANKSLRPPGAFKKKSDLSVKDGHVFLMEYCEERPLLLGNVGMGARLCTYYQKSAPGDQTGTAMRNGNNGLGSVLVLDPADKSPFLGDIKPGCSQSCLETNMYRAPIFQHKVSSTDFLLVRSAKGKLSIRRIDRIDVVGQQEPHMEVMSPGSKGVQTYIMNRLLVYLYREFRAVEKGGLRPFIHADELSAQFPSLSETFLRKRLKHCADLQRGPNGQLLWVMRRNFRIPLEEELRRMVTPENVCAYESMQAGLYRLKRLGITRLTQPSGLSSAMSQLPDEAIALAAASHIERELQITPWNLSSNFVACTNQDRDNIERLEITGVGDPSGRGLGFSFVRATPKAPMSNAIAKKKTVVGKGSTVTGTDADLRRLSMEAAREVLLKFNVPEEQIAKLTRWHRIAMIRKLSSEQAASGVEVDPTTISKYARGQRMSFLQLQQQTREKCQEIWDRQAQSLCAVEGEENESDSEANSDLDSFAGDLENLLDAEEGDEGEESNYEAKHDSGDGVKGLKMRRRPFHAQAEEEIEDEAAEAAELCRMLMDDDEAEQKKKKKVKAAEQVKVGPGSQSKVDPGSAKFIKKATKNKSLPDGSSGFKETAIKFQKEDKTLSAKNLSAKMKTKKKSDIEQMGLLQKKVKILGDGMKIVKEKKSARESFVCGACGQLGHMKTNKHCPKYREEREIRVDSSDQDKGKTVSLDQAEQPQPKIPQKKLIQKSATKIAVVEAHEDDKSISKAKTLKVKCGSTDKLPDKLTPAASQSSEKPATSDAETSHKPVPKVNKIKFANKMKSEDVQVESHKPSVIIKPPTESDRDQPRKKIIIKRSKDNSNVDDVSQETSTGFEHRKTKKIIDLSSISHREQEVFSGEGARRRSKESKRWPGEEQSRKIADKQMEEHARRLHDEQMRLLERDRLAEIRRFEETIRRDREEEERQKLNKKKKKKRTDTKDDYLDSFPPRRNDRRDPELDRASKRKPALELRHGADIAPPTKRRRGGEVGLSNILESIVEYLRNRHDLSYLFLKPVSKKEAPDYLKFVKRPMDLSTIRDKVRKLEYKKSDDFRHDVWQIAKNAHTYNDGRNPGIPPLADQLLEICDAMLDENADRLREAEEGIEF